ncbi:carbohydrate-binding protein [Actinoplanes sp. NPDC051859]|uniref:carbohydrate-binding protein n=1 Tax=Actinoplanes sp. NPDC051859 TaxID=3363909 RepID=UPI003799A50C
MPRHSAPLKHAWIRPRIVVTLAVATAGLATAIWLPTRNDTADASDFRRTTARIPSLDQFSDDFAGPEGSTVDPQKWFLTTNRTGYGVTFSQSTRNARLDGDGNLVIAARGGDRSGVTSAQLVSRSMFRRDSGRVEAKIKVPSDGDGLRPAFALFGTGYNPAGVNLLADPVTDGDFHTYAVSWTQDTVTLTRDGDVLQQVNAPQSVTGQLFRLTLSLLVTDARRADLPAKMSVDHVEFGAEDGGQPKPTTPPVSTPPATPPTSPSATPSEPASTPPTESTDVPTTPPSTEPPATTAPADPPPATTQPPTAAAPTTTAPAEPEVEEWKKFTDYKVGTIIKFKGQRYQVLEAHTSLPGWEPTSLVSLFKKL